jgi:hypothetical protein
MQRPDIVLPCSSLHGLAHHESGSFSVGKERLSAGKFVDGMARFTSAVVRSGKRETRNVRGLHRFLRSVALKAASVFSASYLPR